MADTKETRFTVTADAALRRRMALLKKHYTEKLRAKDVPRAKVTRREVIDAMALDACRYHGLEGEPQKAAPVDVEPRSAGVR